MSNISPRPSANTYNVTVTGSNLATSTLVSISRSDGSLSQTIPSVVLAGEAGTRDLVAIEIPGTPTRGVIKRNISVSGPISVPVDMDVDVNVNSFTAHDFTILQYGTTYTGYVKFVTNNQTRSHGVTKGAFNSPEGYYALEEIVGEVQDEFDNGGIESAIEIKRNSLNPNLTFDFTAVTPLTGLSANASQITGLAYTPDTGMPDLVAYAVEYAQVRISDELEINYILTPNWLGTNSTYVLPDFSGVVGYDSQWGLTTGFTTQVGFTVAMYNVSLGVPLSTNTDWIPNLYAVQPKMRIYFTP